MIRLASAHEVDAVWPHVAAGFQALIDDHGHDLSAGYLWQECRSGRAWLLVQIEDEKAAGASIWRPETWADGHRLRCLGMFGEGSWLPDTNEAVRSLMRDCGAVAMVFDGRRGVARALEKHGLKVREIRTLFEVRY